MQVNSLEQMLEQQRAVEQAREFQKQAMAFEVEARKTQLQYAWLLCSCRPWFSWDSREPAQSGCLIHAGVVVTLDGEVL
jgi:hypothetical protein